MTLKVSKDMHTKFGEAKGSRDRAINLNKNLFTGVDADTWASSIPLTSTLLRQVKTYNFLQRDKLQMHLLFTLVGSIN